MRTGWLLSCAIGLACFSSDDAVAAVSGPPAEIAWAWPPLKAPSSAPSRTRIKRLAGATITYSEAEIHDTFKMVDWHPQGHPPAPPIVRQGHPPDQHACGYCHLPEGNGRPENAALAGLPADYIVRQLGDMRSGARV